MNIIFENPDESLYIGERIKSKPKPISIIQYPRTRFLHIYCVIPDESSSFIVNNYRRYIPSNISIAVNIDVSYVTESFFYIVDILLIMNIY